MEGYDWEGALGRTLESVASSALRLGEQYAGVFFSREQFEAQLDAYERIARLQPRAAPAIPVALLLVAGFVVFALAKK